MIIEHRGIEPRIDESVFIAPTAVICGNVNVGPQARVMYGAIIDSEASAVKIGAFSIICENAVIRATKIEDTNHPVHIGAHAFISPHATLLGCSIASQAYIATGATVLQGAEVGKGAVVAVGALVHANTKIPSGFFLAPNAVAIGDPLKASVCVTTMKAGTILPINGMWWRPTAPFWQRAFFTIPMKMSSRLPAAWAA
jgi:carbonic anhydrase/acetyltransferase-like protein (isoleucine patch superfamily)